MAANFAKFSFCMEGKTIFKVLNHRLDRFFCIGFIVKYTFDARKFCLLFVFLKKSVVANFAKFSFYMEVKTLFDIISKLRINDFIVSFTFEARKFCLPFVFLKKSVAESFAKFCLCMKFLIISKLRIR